MNFAGSEGMQKMITSFILRHITCYCLLDKHPWLSEVFYEQLSFIKCIVYKRYLCSLAPSRLFFVHLMLTDTGTQIMYDP